LNLKSSFLHLMGDVLSTIGAVIAGIVIRFTGANWVDPLVSVLIGLLILWNAWGIVRESVQILMESTPADIDMESLVRDIQAVPGVRGVHDLHDWSLNQSMRTLSAHIVTDDVTVSQGAHVQGAIVQLLADRYQVRHATLQLECPACGPGQIYCNYC
ncbi:MAG: cation diffusion facilitator family transporter, partial [Chloroflexota bacterium]